MCRTTQRLEIRGRVGQAIRVVDPQSLHETLTHPTHDLTVRLLEHPRYFDANTGQTVHSEESTVVQFVVGPPPVHQLIVLPIVHTGWAGTGVGRSGGNRKTMIEVVQFAVDDLQLVELARPVAQHRNANSPPAERPVHVESLGVTRLLAILEQIPPPGILPRRRDPHVVRHDVHEYAPPRQVGRCREPVQGIRPAPGRVDEGMIDDVIPVIRSGLGLQQRREVDPVGTEIANIVDRCCGGIQVEGRGDLQSIGRARDGYRLRCRTT